MFLASLPAENSPEGVRTASTTLLRVYRWRLRFGCIRTRVLNGTGARRLLHLLEARVRRPVAFD